VLRLRAGIRRNLLGVLVDQQRIQHGSSFEQPGRPTLASTSKT
jgi:hypothetical protein